MVDREATSKRVVVVTTDRALRESVVRLVVEQGCHPLAAASIGEAQALVERERPVLVLVDPLVYAGFKALGDFDSLISEIPVRTSANGIRRLAKGRSAASRWLAGLIAERCASASSSSVGEMH